MKKVEVQKKLGACEEKFHVCVQACTMGLTLMFFLLFPFRLLRLVSRSFGPKQAPCSKRQRRLEHPKQLAHHRKES
jgi:hypothetical protein